MKRLLLLCLFLSSCECYAQVKQFYWKQDATGKAVPYLANGKNLNLDSVGVYSKHQMDSALAINRVDTLDGLYMSRGSGITWLDDVSNFHSSVYTEQLSANRTIAFPDKGGTLMSRNDTTAIVYSRHQVDSIKATIHSFQTMFCYFYGTQSGILYNSFSGGGSSWLAYNYTQSVATKAFALCSLYVRIQTAAPNSAATVTVLKNGTATTLVATLSGTVSAGALFSDLTHSVSFAAGDYFSIEYAVTAGNNANATISVLATY